MITIAGIGKYSERIVKHLIEKYENYDEFVFNMPMRDNHEAYEEYMAENAPIYVSKAFEKIGDSFTLFIEADKRGGVILPFLGLLREIVEIEIVVIHKESYISNVEDLGLERFQSGVLQEMSRSSHNLFRHVYLFSLESLDKIFDEIPIMEHVNRISEIIANTYHKKNVCENSEADLVISNLSHLGAEEAMRLEEISKISTFFLFNPEDFSVSKNFCFFPIDIATKLTYNMGVKANLAIKEKILRNDQIKRNDQQVIFKCYDLGSDFNLGIISTYKPQY